MVKQKAIFNWSGGKDSSLALYEIQKAGDYEIQCLLTSVNKEYQRISMHGVRTELLKEQAESIGMPLQILELPEMPDMETYDRKMAEVMSELKYKGAEVSIFGDIFLEDLRKYREDKLSQAGLRGVFPLWKRDTKKILEEFLDLGFQTILTCVHEKYLDKGFAGRIIDRDFIKDLPSNVDHCGENGEFHTFVFDGPIFKKPINFTKGEVVYRSYKKSSAGSDVCAGDDPFQYGFWYCDLIPVSEAT